MGNPRRIHAGARDKLRRQVAALGMPCAICGQPIDYSLPAGHPFSYELDEIIPVSRAEQFGYASAADAAVDPGNVRPAHRICNQKRQNKMTLRPPHSVDPGAPGVDW